MLVRTNHLGIINLNPSELRSYLSTIDEKWDFDGWDHLTLLGLILREDENGEIVFTVSNGKVAREVGGLPATQDMFSGRAQSSDIKQLFLSGKFGVWVKARLAETDNDFAGLMNSKKFKNGIIPALDKQHQLQKDWVSRMDPDYRQPYEVRLDKVRLQNESFLEKLLRKTVGRLSFIK